MPLPDVEVQHILYATDFSENAKHGYAYAASIANRYDAKCTVLHVVQEELLDMLMFDVGTERAVGVEKRLAIMKERFTEARKQIIEKLQNEYGHESFRESDILVERGNPVKLILGVAHERECDLIIMGVKGKGALQDSLMGDTVRRVLHRAHVPVLVVTT